jgi:hypothetical protein
MKLKLIEEQGYLYTEDKKWHLPLNNNPIIPNLGLLPEIVVEDDVESKINKALKYWRSFDGEKQKGIAYGLGLALEHYKAATKVYSEEDVRKAIEIGEKCIILNSRGSYLESKQLKESFIQSLKQPTPKWFVAEMETPYTDAFTEDRIRRFYGKPKLKTTTINGKTYLVGKFKK